MRVSLTSFDLVGLFASTNLEFLPSLTLIWLTTKTKKELQEKVDDLEIGEWKILSSSFKGISFIYKP